MNKSTGDYININRHDVHGKNVLITGSTSGIGREAALHFGKLGANVYVHGRDKEKGKELKKHLREKIGTKSQFFKSDFSKLQEVRATSEMIKEEIDEIDILINNAGCFCRGNKTGTNGIEYTFVVNYLSGFLLTLNLMPLLIEADNPSHIVFTSSSSHKSIDSFSLNHVENNTMNNWESYSRSKLANVMLSIALAQRLDDKKVLTSSVHPGMIVETRFLRNLPTPIEQITSVAGKLPLPGVSSKYEGAATLINTIDITEYSSIYYNRFEPERPAKLAQNTRLQNMLWDYSVDVTNAELIEEARD